MARVVLDRLTKVFPASRGDGLRAVDSASLAIEDRELLVLVGPSGCGKTTMLRLIAGLDEPTEGSISVDGQCLNGVPPGERDIAMVFQHHALLPHMSAWENMAFGLKLRKVPRAEIEARVREAADMLGLAQCLERRPEALSGGERQRVALGRAIVRRPRVFLFDEPLSNLDAGLRLQLRAEIARLHRRLGATMLYVTHDQDEAMTLGDRVAVMRQGVIQQVADPLTLYQRPANGFVAGFMGSPPMNFFRGRILPKEGELVFAAQSGAGTPPPDAFTLRLDAGYAKSLETYAERPVILGLRPEHICLNSAQKEAPPRCEVEAVVELVHAVGPETRVHLTSAGHAFVARLPATVAVRLDQRLRLAFDMGQAHFFDPATERAIR
jgi:multiple sugar transport system ATP-binding protein